MNIEMARDRLQQVADAAIAGNRLMARLELESVLEFAEQHPAVWFWHAWTAGSPAEAKASLQQVAAIWPDHPLAAAGLAWVEGLEQLAAGDFEDGTESLDESQLAATELAATELADPELAVTELAVTELAVTELAVTELAAAELDLESCEAPAAASTARAASQAVTAAQVRSEAPRPSAPGVHPEAAPEVDLETDLLATLAAIHDEVFATLYVPDERDVSGPHEGDASHLEHPAAARRSVLGKFRTAHR